MAILVTGYVLIRGPHKEVWGPYLFNVFLDDLEVFMNDTPVLFKYADDSTILAPVWKDSNTSADLVNQFLSWSINNQMLCNPSKFKELIFRKKESRGTRHQYASINSIPQCDRPVLLGPTFQPNCKLVSTLDSSLQKLTSVFTFSERYERNSLARRKLITCLKP